MQFQTEGLIIRENVVGESDRIVTVLTADQGLLRAFVRKAKDIKNRGNSATQLLCYSRLTFYRGREKYIIGDARPIKVFFALHEDISRLALAQYFCEIAGKFVPENTPSQAYLRLLLNALYYLSQGEKKQALLKAAVEMRLLSFSGYMPDLVGCSHCGEFLTDEMAFFPEKGNLLCSRCVGELGHKQGACVLPKSAVTALRHTVYAEFEKLFAFSVSPSTMKAFSRAAEEYMLSCIGYCPKTLSFYHSMTEN
jgi:DNA repair protein RecO (recombination protein O)